MISKKFKTWNALNVTTRNRAVDKQSYVSIRRAGALYFSPFAAGVLGLKKDDCMLFFQGEEYSSELFVAKTKDKETGIRVKADKRGRLYVNGKTFTDTLIEHIGSDGSLRVRMGNVAEAMPKGEGLPPAAYRLYLNECAKK